MSGNGNGKSPEAEFYLIRHGATPLNSQDGGVDLYSRMEERATFI